MCSGSCEYKSVTELKTNTLHQKESIEFADQRATLHKI